MPTKVKICGLKTEAALEAALAGGADYVGLVFFPPSPRNVTPAVAKALAARARGRAKIVALMVDPDDALIAEVVASAAPDLIQLHGHETPTRVAEIRARWGIPVMKAVPVETADDARAARQFSPAADLILFDALAPADSARPGGNGAPFDWRTLLGVTEGIAVRALGRAHPRQRRRGHPPDRGDDRRCLLGRREPSRRKGPGADPPLPSRGKGRITSCPRGVEGTPRASGGHPRHHCRANGGWRGCPPSRG